MTDSQEPELFFCGPLEPEPLEKKYHEPEPEPLGTKTRSQSHLKKKSGARAGSGISKREIGWKKRKKGRGKTERKNMEKGRREKIMEKGGKEGNRVENVEKEVGDPRKKE